MAEVEAHALRMPFDFAQGKRGLGWFNLKSSRFNIRLTRG